MEKEEGKEFQRALSDFMYDFASGDAIRHLADAGLTISQITAKLSFPTPKDRVARTVWKHYIDQGIILQEEPKEGEMFRKVSYVTEQGAYGKVSMRQVVEEVQIPKAEYLPCDFGKRIYRDKEGFQESLKRLSETEKQYLLELPWPCQTVWHIRNERMNAIWRKLSEVD